MDRTITTGWFERALWADRPRVVGLCAHLAGDREVAEDLAQETLLEAWRNRDKLVEPAGFRPWISAIARNVCRRWHSQGRRRSAPLGAMSQAGTVSAASLEDVSADIDIEFDLDRHELENLLDRAMALLPAETRAILVERFIEQSPHAATAARYGLSEGAVKMRIQRGKLALRSILVAEMADAAVAFGITSIDSSWNETRMWCPLCGAARLEASLDREQGDFVLRCPNCYRADGLYVARAEQEPNLLAGIKGYKPLLNRITHSSVPWLRHALCMNDATCPWCNSPATVHNVLPADCLPRRREARGAHVQCTNCRRRAHFSLGGLIADHPAVQRFWREHPRMRTLPEREVEIDGRPMLIVGMESVHGFGALDVIVDRETFSVTETHLL